MMMTDGVYDGGGGDDDDDSNDDNRVNSYDELCIWSQCTMFLINYH